MHNLLPSMITVLSTTAPRWQRLTETLPLELLARVPAPREWSALQCLGHLLDAERLVFPVRVQCFLKGQDFPAFDPDAQGMLVGEDQPPHALAAEFARLREASLTALEALTEADLPRTARHSELGPVMLSELLHEWAAHDLMHTVQAERALMQPFIAECGPWRRYFADHDAALKRS